MLRDLMARLRSGKQGQAAAPQDPDWLARGNAALAQGDVLEAERCYREATTADPQQPLARVNLAFVLLERDPATALQYLQQAIALRRPADDFLHEARYLCGRALRLLGQRDQAISALAEAVRLRPDFAPAHQEGLAVLREQGRDADAQAWAERWVAADANPSSLTALAQVLNERGRHAEALEALDAVLAAAPSHHAALEGRAYVLLALHRPEEALSIFDRLLAAGVRSANVLSSRGAALQQCGRIDEALDAVDEALVLEAHNRDALYNRARILLEMHRLPDSDAAWSRLLEILPEDADARWGRAMVRLLAGEYAGGWRDYEARWQAAAAGRDARPDAGVPWWTGSEDIEGKRVLVHKEQGLGDAIQFVRYARLLQDRGARVMMNMPAILSPLVQDAFPGCELAVDGEAVDRPDFQCMLLSLPLAFGTTLESVPARIPYLRSRPELRSEWEQRLGPRKGLRVGVVWSGAAGFSNDAKRSIPLERFRAIELPGVEFVSLQKEVRESDRAALASWPALSHHGDALRSFADTAALADVLDLVISVDTSVGHLAGALGRPLWMLLPHWPDWRWMLEREDSPWYPTARLFRQPAAGDWTSVLARVREELRKLAATAPA